MKVIEEYVETVKKCPNKHNAGILEPLPLMENLQKYCTVCGEGLIDVSEKTRYEKEVCPNCGLATADGWAFCPWCGLISCIINK
jgi:hypothetical protein